MMFKDGRIVHGTGVKRPPEYIQVDNLYAMLEGYRKRRKLSRRALAAFLGISRNGYMRWANGAKPNVFFAEAIAQCLKAEAKSISSGKIRGLPRKKNYFRAMKSISASVDKIKKMQAIENQMKSEC